MGLPMYVDIDQKPKSGCEIQSVRCRKSSIMIQLKLVRTKSCHKPPEKSGNMDENEGTQVLKELTQPQAKTNCLAVANFLCIRTGSACIVLVWTFSQVW